VARVVHNRDPVLLELTEAFEVGDAHAVVGIADRIKGKAGQLGGKRLVTSCNRPEEKATLGLLSDGNDELHEVELRYREICHILVHQQTPELQPFHLARS